MNRLLKIALLTLGLSMALAGGAQTQDDKSRLIKWLETSLSSAGRQVTIDGFSGALSARSTVQRLTIADQDGVWLVLEDAVLSWNRTAVLKGQIDISELSARRLILTRKPVTAPADTTPESSTKTSLRLPDLPVSIDIAKLQIGQVLLADTFLGLPVTLAVEGQMTLKGGAGEASLSLKRLDAASGEMLVQFSYDNETRDLSLLLDVAENQGGIVATALNLPDRPALKFNVQGEGKLPEFNAQVALVTDGQPRVSGNITLRRKMGENTTTRTDFMANLKGDISRLLAAQYRPFFGSDTDLNLRGALLSDGKIDLESLQISTNALSLSGSMTLASDHLPERFALTVRLLSKNDTPTVLPFGQGNVQLGGAKIDAQFDANTGDIWSLDAIFTNFSTPAVQIGSGRVAATGLLFRKPDSQESGIVQRVTAMLSVAANDIQAGDVTIASAIGPQLAATADFDWQSGGALDLRSFTAVAGELAATGQATFAGNSDGFRVSGAASLRTGPLERFALIVAQPFLAGSADLAASGWWQPVGGAFDLSLNGKTIALKLRPKPGLALLAGNGAFDTSISRDTTGLQIKNLELRMPGINAAIAGKLASKDSDLSLDVRIGNIGSLVPGFSGPATLIGSIAQTGKPWLVSLTAQGPGGANARLTGDIDVDEMLANLAISGALPVGLANNFLPQNISVQGQTEFDLTLAGPLEPASLSGEITTGDTGIVLADFGLSFENARGSAKISDGTATLDFTAFARNGGQINIQGRQQLSGPMNSDLAIKVSRLNFVQEPVLKSTIDANLRISGPLAQTSISGVVNLIESELRLMPVPAGGEIPPIVHRNDTRDIRATRLRAGFKQATQAGNNGAKSGIGLNITLNAPSRIFIRGRGLDAEMGGTLQISGTSQSVIPSGQFDLIRGRLDLLGKRFDLESGALSLQGTLDPTFQLAASTRTNTTTVRVEIAGTPHRPNVTFSSEPPLPQDEVLAQLLFGKSIANVSPLQALKLAQAVATLTGDGRDGIVGKLRNRFGLDDLDLVSTPNGGLAVKAGKYINENTYANVTTDSQGKTRIQLNLDLSPGLTARGSASSDGGTSLGLFYESDY